MNDGLFVNPIIENGRIIGWTRGETIIVGAAYYKDLGTDLRFLRYVNGEVIIISQEEQDAILEQDEINRLNAIAEEEQAAIDRANAPFEVSKYKLSLIFQLNGKLTDFMSFINEDPERAFLWNAAQVLDSDNPMVLAALNEISDLLPEGMTARDVLNQCKI